MMNPEAYDDDEDENVDDLMAEMVRKLLAQMHSNALHGKPTALVLPAEKIEELQNYCQEHSIPKEKLIPLAMRDCLNRVEEFVALMAEYWKNPDDFQWPLSPLDCVVIAFLLEAIRRFEEEPSDDESDQADWWKAEE